MAADFHAIMLEDPSYSEPVSRWPVSPCKLFRCFSKFPLFMFPITFPVIYGRLWPPVKLPGNHKCCKTKQNGGRRRTFVLSSETTARSHQRWPVLAGMTECEVIERFRPSGARIERLVEEIEAELERNTARSCPLAMEMQINIVVVLHNVWKALRAFASKHHINLKL